MKTFRKLIVGSRGSQLALWQSEWVKAALTKAIPNCEVEIAIIKTTGDKILDSPLSKIGDKGLFTREIEHELLEHHIDLAVHSLKDLPTELPSGLVIGAVTRREHVHDVFISHTGKQHRTVGALPPGASVATGSLRRTCQLFSWRPDLKVIDLRGNLNTRFAKLDESGWDGMILAQAGVVRLGWQERISEILPFDRMLPAVGQGALAVEIRDDDIQLRNMVMRLNSEPTFLATTAERSLLRHLEGGCQIPIGAYGRIEQNRLFLDALVGSLDGKRIVRGSINGSIEDPEALGIQLGETLLKSGGKEILREIRSPKQPEMPEV